MIVLKFERPFNCLFMCPKPLDVANSVDPDQICVLWRLLWVYIVCLGLTARIQGKYCIYLCHFYSNGYYDRRHKGQAVKNLFHVIITSLFNSEQSRWQHIAYSQEEDCCQSVHYVYRIYRYNRKGSFCHFRGKNKTSKHSCVPLFVLP